MDLWGLLEFMDKRIKHFSVWLRRRSHLAVLAGGIVIIGVLSVNDDTSLTRNLQYQRRISELKEEIQQCKDSARYYKEKREAILNGTSALEYAAREQYHMQRPTEDVFIVK